MAHPTPTTGLLTKGVALHMVQYVSGTAPTFSDSNIVANLQEFPSVLPEISSVDITVLDDGAFRYIPGLRQTPDVLNFTFLYEKNVFKQFYDVSDYAGHPGVRQWFALEFPDGVMIKWSGFVSPSINGAGVNSALTFTANVTADSDFEVSGLTSSQTGPTGPSNP